ncbi:MAG: hypothetical protein AUJ97_02410 [Bacteroidetes bacterium CG2_30_32_10]|nr:MAG: hypothetical protein AUJ97_02410 [Bacteroidetes bacterium CG2_30_32_10]
MKINSLKPAISKKHLLVIAGIIWSFAGGMLLTKGISLLLIEKSNIIFELIIGVTLGILFYFFMFSKISFKHIDRIFRIEITKPCLFSFFSIRSYVMMILMISTGIGLRKLDIINHEVLSVFYITMGTPLLMSSMRFYYYWFKYKSLEKVFLKSS